ncbi:acetyltransferase [Candidatus Bipolaricaulota bacterium]|nr:acetyltransferase [Candidatus Bipolaricaulota bacterium]
MPKDVRKLDLLIYGASGHGKVVLDAALRIDRYSVLGVLDDDPSLHGRSLCGVPVIGGFEQLEGDAYRHCRLVLGIGSGKTREHLANRIQHLGYEFVSLVHPYAQIGMGVSLGLGTVVMAGVCINADTTIGNHVIVNTGATVDHDCIVEEFAHIAPGVHLAGNVRVGRLAHVGLGACVVQGVTIGEGSVIGAGAAVTEDVPPQVVVAGVPARVIRELG